MKTGALNFVFVFFVLVGLTCGQIPEFPINLTQQTLKPCSYLEFKVDYSEQQRTVQSYDTFTLQELNNTQANLEMIVSPTQLSLSEIIEAADAANAEDFALTPQSCRTGTPGSGCSFDLTCKIYLGAQQQPAVTTWYVFIIARTEIANPVTFKVQHAPATVSNFVASANFQLGVQYNLTVPNYMPTNFGSRYYFYELSLNALPKFSSLNISVSAEPADAVSQVSLFKGALPSGQDGCVEFNNADPKDSDLIVSECLLTAGTWYISVLPLSSLSNFTYHIIATNPAPTPVEVTSQASKLNSVTDTDDIRYFSFAVPASAVGEENGNQQLNITIYDVEGGNLDVAYMLNELPFLSCLGTTIPQCRTNTMCNLIIQSCDLEEGTYFIGVRPNSIFKKQRALTYLINATLSDIPSTLKLTDGVSRTDQLLPNQYQFYQLSTSSGSINDDTWLEVLLYVDTVQTTGGTTQVFVNPTERASANPSSLTASGCYSNNYTCTVSQTSSSGSCSIQLTTCDFNEFSSWYISVLSIPPPAAGTGISEYGASVRYTVRAQTMKPVTLDTSHLVNTGIVAANEYNHYVLNTNLLPKGDYVMLYISNVINGEVRAFLNYGALAGDSCSTRACYMNKKFIANIKSGEISKTMLSNCDGNDQSYVSVKGEQVSAGILGVTYTITIVTEANEITTPIQSLDADVVKIDSISTKQQTNYTLNLGSNAGKSRELVLTLVYLQATTNDALTLNLYNSTSLNCLDTAVKSCTLAANAKQPYCVIVLEPCEFEQYSTYVAQVTTGSSAENINFNLKFAVNNPSAQSLSNGEFVASNVGQDQYKHYSLSVDGNNTFVIEVYFDESQNEEGYLYVSHNSEAGMGSTNSDLSGCFENDFSCFSKSKCVYVQNACDLMEGTIYFSVFTKAAVNLEQPLQFTIRASEIDAVIPIASNLPASYELYPTQKIYHTFEVAEVQSTQGEVRYIEIGNIPAGSVSVYLAEGLPLVHCPCFQYQQDITVTSTQGYGVISLQYCNTSPNTKYTILVEGSNPGDLSQNLGYTITMVDKVQTPTQLTLGEIVHGNAVNDYYAFYKLPTLAANARVVLDINNIRGGTVEVLFSTAAPATSQCLDSTICKGSSENNPCLVQLSTCVSNYPFFSVMASADSADPVFFDVSVTQSNILALSTDGTTVTSNADSNNFYTQFMFNITEADYNESPFVTVAFTEVTSPIFVQIQTDVCDQTVAPSSCAGTTCTYELGFCALTSGFNYIFVQNRGAEQANFTIGVTMIKLATAETALANDPKITAQVINPNSWVNYRFSTVNEFTVPATRKLTITASANTTGIDFYYSFGTEAATISPCSTLFARTVSLSSCCTENGTYHIAIRNRNDGTNNRVSAFDLNVEYAEVSKEFPPLTQKRVITTSKDVYGEVSTTIARQPQYSSITWKIEDVQSSGAAAGGSFYVENISPAGKGSETCFSNFDSCAAVGIADSNQCNTFLGPCDVGSYPIGGTYMLAGENTANDISFAASVVSQSITGLEFNKPINAAVAVLAGTTMYYVINTTMPYYPTLAYAEFSITANNPVTLTVLGELSACQAIASCTSSTTCPLKLSLCGRTGQLFVAIKAVGNQLTSIETLSVKYDTEKITKALTAVDSTAEQIDLTETLYYSMNVSNYSPTTEVEVTFTINGGSRPALSYVYESNSCFGTTLCNNGFNADDVCKVTLNNCQIGGGLIYFRVTPTIAGTNYTLKAEVVERTVNSTKLGQLVLKRNFLVDDRDYYSITVSQSDFQPGQHLEFKLNANYTCGTVELFVFNGDSVASESCNINCAASCSATTGNVYIYQVSACDILSKGVSTTYYYTVRGKSQLYQQYTEMVYEVSAYIVGTPVKFVAMKSWERVTYNTSTENTIFVYPIEGLKEHVGEVSLSCGRTSLLTTNAGVSYGFQAPSASELSCGAVSSGSCSFTQFQLQNTVPAFQMCDLRKRSHLYVSWNAGAKLGDFFDIVRTNPFIRDITADLDDDDYQSGAVIEEQQEFYKFNVNTTIPGFRLNITLQNMTPNAGQAELWYSQSTDMGACGGSKKVCNASTGCGILVPGCAITSDDIFVTVTGKHNSLTTYDLIVTVVAMSEELAADTPICSYAPPLQTNLVGESLYSGEITAPTQFTYLQASLSAIESVNGASVDLYLDTDNIPSSCSPVIVKGCTSKCSARMTCVPVDAETVNIAVKNSANNKNATYFIEWTEGTIQPTAFSAQLDATSEGNVDGMLDFYTTNVAASDTEATVVHLMGSTGAIIYASNTGLPSSGCGFVKTCTVGASGSCSFPLTCELTGAVYFSVQSSAAYTIHLSQVMKNTDAVTMGEIKEAIFYPPYENYHTFKVTLGTNFVAPGSLQVQLYGLNRGEITGWLTKSSAGDEACAIAANSNQVSFKAEEGKPTTANWDYNCRLDAGDYYVTLFVTKTGGCSQISYRLLVSEMNAAMTAPTLNLGAVTTNDIPLASNTKTYQFAYTTGSYLIARYWGASSTSLKLISGSLVTEPSTCATSIVAPTTNLGKCMNSGTYFVTYIASAATKFGNNQFSFEFSTKASTALTEATPFMVSTLAAGPAPVGYSSANQMFDFYNIQFEDKEAVTIVINVLSGPAISVDIRDSSCESSNGNIASFTCFHGECQVPFTSEAETLPESVDITISGMNPSQYNISYTFGSDNCMSSTSELEFCSGIGYSFYAFGNSADVDTEAEILYEQLELAFCPNTAPSGQCECRELTQKCKDALLRYSCETAFRGCDSDGFQTSACENTCLNVEDECGTTFTKVGLDSLECNHNFYLQGTSDECKDRKFDGSTLGSSSSSGGFPVWAIVLLVIVGILILLAILAVIGYFVYKKQQHSNYEKI